MLLVCHSTESPIRAGQPAYSVKENNNLQITDVLVDGALLMGGEGKCIISCANSDVH